MTHGARLWSRLFLMLTIAQTLGCAATFWAGNRSTTLRLGMSKRQAQALLGSPQQMISQEAQGAMVETWRYLDRVLIFRNGLLYSITTQSSGVATP